MSVALVSLCARRYTRCSFTSRHPSNHPLPDHPFVGLGLAGTRSLTATHTICGVFGRAVVCLRLATFLCICRLSSVRTTGRARRSGFTLFDYEAISIIRIRFERQKTKILVGPTSAFDVVGELEDQVLRTWGRGRLRVVSQHKDDQR